MNVRQTISPDYRDEELSLSATRRWIDRVCPDGTWRPISFSSTAVCCRSCKVSCQSRSEWRTISRIDESPAHISIREAFINLCVHADYSAEGSLLVVKRGDSFIFSNPGTLLVSLQQYYEGGESVCRTSEFAKDVHALGNGRKSRKRSGQDYQRMEREQLAPPSHS